MNGCNALLWTAGLVVWLTLSGCVTEHETITVLDPAQPILEVAPPQK